MMTDDRHIADARERLRKKAQNEATCFALNDMLKDAQDEVRRLREENERLANDMSRCYRMLLSEPDVKGALFKAENILRESLADRGKK